MKGNALNDDHADRLAESGEWVDRFARRSTTWIWDYLFRLKTYGSEHVPKQGAFLLAPNHASYIDPFIHTRGLTSLARSPRFLAKAELFSMPVIRWFVKMNCVPIQRGAKDARALEVSREIIERELPLVVYAEGTRFRSDLLLGQPKRGLARLAIESGVPVVPVSAWGNKPRRARGESRWPLRLPRVTTVFGPPMSFGDRTVDDVDAVRDAIWAEVHRLNDIARQLGGPGKKRPRTFVVPSPEVDDQQATRNLATDNVVG